MPKLLALLSNPDNEVKLRMDRELKLINQNISPKVTYDFECQQINAIGVDELPVVLIREKPHLVHFSGHGKKDVLCFEDKAGKSQQVSSESLCTIFNETQSNVICIFLNCCKSSEVALKLSSIVPYAIGYPDNIDDEIAITFAKTFYEVLSHGKSVPTSFKIAEGVIKSLLDDSKNHPKLFINNTTKQHISIFKEPQIITKFVTSSNGNAIKSFGMYKLEFDIINLPFNATYIVYEFIDVSIGDDNRFALINDLSSGTKYIDTLYGDIILKCWIWLDSKQIGIGINSTIKKSLDLFYSKIPKKLESAYQDITQN